MKTEKINTNHFVGMSAALSYYKDYGFDLHDVEEKIKNKEIALGEPPRKPGDRLTSNTEGRFVILREYEEKPTFGEALIGFLDKFEKARAIALSPGHKLTTMEGKKYLRIVDENSGNKSAAGFIEKETGDIFKAASWKAPAKNKRGNIFSENNGMEAVRNGFIRYM